MLAHADLFLMKLLVVTVTAEPAKERVGDLAPLTVNQGDGGL
jgi:hypothetical protein